MEINSENITYSANCLISMPVYYPGLELIQFNGFSWSNSLGIIHQTNSQIVPNSVDWFGNQDG